MAKRGACVIISVIANGSTTSTAQTGTATSQPDAVRDPPPSPIGAARAARRGERGQAGRDQQHPAGDHARGR